MSALKRSLAVSWLLLAAAAPLRADFEDLGVGARALGMGNAFVALADDSKAVSYNPAGLAFLRRAEFSADYGRLYTGLDDGSNLSTGFFSFALPMSRRKGLDERIRDLRRVTAMEAQLEISSATLSGKQAQRRAESLTFFRDLGTLGIGLSNMTLSGAVSENSFFLSYGRKIIERLSGGLSVKVLYQSYTQDAYTQRDPVFSNGGKSDLLKYSIDAGALYNLAPRIFWGLAVANLNSPNLALNPSDKEILHPAIKTGFAFREKKLNTALDGVVQRGDYRIHAGAERWFKNKLYAARLGGGYGNRNYKSVSAGGSLNWGNIQLDYALIYPVSGVKEVYGSHRISFTYRFGKAPITEMETGSIELYYAKLQAEAEVLRAKLEKTEDDRSKLEKVLIEEALSRIHEKVRAERLEAGAQRSSKKDGGAPAAEHRPLSSIGGTAISGIKTYVTGKGDSLQTVAELFYGKKERWIEIYNLNKDKVGRGGSLKPGTVLLIPGVAGEAPNLDAPAAKGSAMGQTLTPVRQKTSSGSTLAPIQQKSPAKEEKEKEPARPKTYMVQSGDTLSSIARKFYGDSKLWKEIYNANKEKIERGSVEPGTVLELP